MRTWKEILLDKSLPNPIPPPPYSDLDSRFNFVDREEEERKILNYIDRAKVDGFGFLMFLLADQGRGKTSFLRNLVNKYSLKESDTTFTYMNFPMDVKEFNFIYIYRNYISSLFQNGVMERIYRKITEKIKNIFKLDIKDFDEIRDITDSLSFKTKIPFPYISTLLLYSFPPSPYSIDVFRFIEGDELQIDEPKLNYLFPKNDRHAISMIERFSEFIKTYLRINHNVLIMDDFDVIDRNQETFRSLYKFLINFRNQRYLIKNFSLILSGSVTFYEEFMDSLLPIEKERMESWIYSENLDHLDTDYFIEMINSTFSDFWKSYLENVPFPENIFGVFSRKTIEFLYEYEDKNLRATLRKMHDIINEMREKGEIEDYIDIDKVIKKFKKDKISLKSIELDYFIKKIKETIKREKSSTFVNKGIRNFIYSMKDEFKNRGIFIEVKNEKNIGGNFADIYLTIDRLDPPSSHSVIFEVKMEEKPVSYKDIKSRVDMLRAVKNSYLYWITKSELTDVVSPDDLRSRVLRSNPLNSTELSYLSYIVFFEKYFNLNEISFQNKLTLLKQAGIDFEIILNPPRVRSGLNLDEFIHDLLKDLTVKQTKVTKRKVVDLVKKENGFKDLSYDFILERVIDISKNLGFKVRPDYIVFKHRIKK